MSQNKKILLLAGAVLTICAGIFIIPKLQNKYANSLYKACNRKLLRDKHGITVTEKKQGEKTWN